MRGVEVEFERNKFIERLTENRVRQMIQFLEKAVHDYRIGPNHVALYMALFRRWCICEESTFYVNHHYIQRVAKIGRSTYHKCIHQLHQYGYIVYTPSYSPTNGSLVSLVELPGNYSTNLKGQFFMDSIPNVKGNFLKV